MKSERSSLGTGSRLLRAVPELVFVLAASRDVLRQPQGLQPPSTSPIPAFYSCSGPVDMERGCADVFPGLKENLCTSVKA